ncbi:TPA: bacteriophage abortive infection AbiH family protein [Vibrio harveyi]|uniref:bacteriophage abortive infection AbiH family protein n=1 Tax=Vibrio harveyi TaxID=669 RepID=UPI00330D60E3|nr:bacteriophage abortive infection AbiH family protein [Vibrio harveyi]
MSDILYIIGNGFDLHHGMKTSYNNFKLYLKEKHGSIFNTVDNFLNIDENWSDFEEALGDLDIDYLEDNAASYLTSYGDENWKETDNHDYEYQIAKNLNALSLRLYECFFEWINTVELPIDPTLLSLKPNALFLTFNYTRTLSEIYKIPDSNVLHIHGSVEEQSNKIVLGHGWSPEERFQMINHIDENTDTRVASGYHAIDKYFKYTHKSIESILNKNQPFFSSLSSIRVVYVLGHSMSNVDLEYFRVIASQVTPDTNWYVTYHEQKDVARLSRALNTIRVSNKNIHFIKMEQIK